MFGVAIGEKYEKQARVMTDSFRYYNRDWETKIFTEKELNFLLPRVWHSKDAFFKCEIGRWCVMKQVLLNHYDVALYCDNDMFWYAEYPIMGKGFSLSPHYISNTGKRDAIRWLIRDGVPNLGMFEACGPESLGPVDSVITEVCNNPDAHFHGKLLWLQNLVTYLPYFGYEVNYMTDPGLNVARWNLAHGDRTVTEENGVLTVTCDGVKSPLRSFHFSSKSVGTLQRFGKTVETLRDEYVRRIS